MKPVLISGIQPSGRLHVGNYLGALKNFVDLQNSGKYECYFFVADLHALTENPGAEELNKNILNLAADFLAAGIVAKKATIFLQSQIPAHSELAWILSTIAPVGELRRMTQFKDKGKIMKEISGVFKKSFIKTPADLGYFTLSNEIEKLDTANVGLFNYPILMAADILLYDAAIVPVGNDQLQHLELTRTLAHKFNTRFGKTFVEPQPLLTKTPRVMSLKNPEKKMSKSQPEGCLFLDDPPEEIKKKISHAVTDSGSEIEYDPKKKPGISNLLEIYCAFSNMEPKLVAEEFADQNYSRFKSRLGELVANYFADFREKKANLMKNPELLKKALRHGSEQAAVVAEKKIKEVKEKIGIEI